MSKSARELKDAALPSLGGLLDFMRLVWQLDHSLQRASKRMELSVGVTGPQRLVLRIVGRFPGLPAGHLARLLHLHPSTVTGILQRLQRQGLLRRHADPRDARRALLGLTSRGRAFDVAGEGTIEAVLRDTLERLPAAKVAATREVLGALAEALGGL